MTKAAQKDRPELSRTERATTERREVKSNEEKEEEKEEEDMPFFPPSLVFALLTSAFSLSSFLFLLSSCVCAVFALFCLSGGAGEEDQQEGDGHV